MSEFRVDQITNQSGSRGPDIAGITTFSATSGMLMPSGTTEYRGGRGRGLFGGGYTFPAPTTNFNIIDYVTIATLGNALDFGDLAQQGTNNSIGACASSTRGVWGGGSEEPSTNSNVIQFVTISSTGNSFDFGDLTFARRSAGACSSSTRGIWAGGRTPTSQNVIDYITISTLGNASVFGDLNRGHSSNTSVGACSSPTRGIFAGGYSPNVNTITFITIANTGNGQYFGDLTVPRSSGGCCSNLTRGIFAGGNSTNVIDYFTIASSGNAIDFGDLTYSSSQISACSNSSRGIFAGGYFAPGGANIISFVTIASTGNASDFGDLTQGRAIRNAGCSDAHGGLGD
jgi:hypothetical protein